MGHYCALRYSKAVSFASTRQLRVCTPISGATRPPLNYKYKLEGDTPCIVAYKAKTKSLLVSSFSMVSQ